jgi:carboxypeptidase family protein
VHWTLSGTVRDGDAQTAIAGARVAIVNGVNNGRTVVTDAQGTYRLDTLDGGAFNLEVGAEGFSTDRRPINLTSDLTVDVGLKKAAAPAPTPNIVGTAIDGVTDQRLPGVVVRITGIGEVVTGNDGSFQLSTSDPEQVRSVTLSSDSTIDRQTYLRAPGPPATLSLMPRSLDLTAFDQMFRSGGSLARWTSAPSLVIQTRVLQFTNVSDQEYTATTTVMSDAEVNALAADLGWALPQLTGNNFGAFAGQQRETAAPGERVRVTRTGQIVVARYVGLQAATTFWGYGRWQISNGDVRAGVVMLDDGFENSGSQFRRSLRAHELGHSLGYNHVTARDSVMNSAARLEPNAFDKDGAKLAFLRPPLNRSPDSDPDAFTTNVRAFVEGIWHGAK